MVFETKQEQDDNTVNMIKNLICDEVAFNLRKRSQFNSYHEFMGYLQEEMDEIIEALNDFNSEIDKIWKMIKRDEVDEKIIERMIIASNVSIDVIHEGVHVASVIHKAVEQLKNVPTTDQSK